VGKISFAFPESVGRWEASQLWVWIATDYDELCCEAARRIARVVLRRPDATLALPTGQTPKGMYRKLVHLSREGIADLSQTVLFNLDEYFGLPPDHPRSFRYYIHEHLLQHVQVREAHIPDSLTSDPEVECRRYEELIASHGGIDLAVLGLGPNGHIAFNEPGTPWESLTHLAELSPETRRREAQHFGGLERVPHQAITMGIRTIMNARSILLLASGREKAQIVRRSLLGPVTPEVPASVLQLHPNVTVLLDRAAAAELPEHAPYLAIELLLTNGCPAPSGGS